MASRRLWVANRRNNLPLIASVCSALNLEGMCQLVVQFHQSHLWERRSRNLTEMTEGERETNIE